MYQSLKVIFLLAIIEAVYGFIIPRESIFKERPQLPASKWIELRSPDIPFLRAPTFLRILNRGKILTFIKLTDINEMQNTTKINDPYGILKYYSMPYRKFLSCSRYKGNRGQ